jgi:hypothetical protein
MGHEQSPRRVEILARRFTDEPDTITLRKGCPVVVVLQRIDVTHGIKIEAFNEAATRRSSLVAKDSRGLGG